MQPAYARVSTDESGAVPSEGSSSTRRYIPWVAFALGALLAVGYYEGTGLGLSSQPPDLETEGATSTLAIGRKGGSYGFSGGGISGGASLKVGGKGVGSSSSSSSDRSDPESSASSADLSSDLLASLLSAQRLADERQAEARELRLELDALRAASTGTAAKLSRCEAESAALVSQASSRARADQAAARASADASAPSSNTAAASSATDGFDIDAYRAARLAATPPNIIECAEASEGESQEACHLPSAERFSAIGQKGATVWMTGLSGSGKSTIAKALERKLVVELGLSVQNLDGDNVRTGLNRDLGFSPGDRAESVRRVGEMACLFSGGGVITLVTLVSPYRADRDAARARHEAMGIPFIEVLMDVPLEVVQARDPKGLYAKAAAGTLKGMTGMSADAPYEAPLRAEVVLPNYKLTVDASVAILMGSLKAAGCLTGGPTHPLGLPLPYGTTAPGAFLEDELTVTDPDKLAALLAEALTLPQALLSDIEINWLQVIGEGWAAPLKGFLREGPLMQVLHFNSLITDPFNRTGASGLLERPTDWNDYSTRGTERVSLSVPITLAATAYTKAAIESSGKKAVALVDKDGRVLAVLRDPEVFEHRKEEIVTRCFGVIDPGHPYVKHIYGSGDWLIGGEVTLLGKVRYHDGLDKWRKSPRELYAEFEAKGADVVYAFQTRNPTHAGHAYLMKTGLTKLKEKGFKRPLLWLSPLGGWTKDDDVPLDVRVKQHQAIIDEGMLDAATTVMAIWPAPMVYGGPTEVQFHASARRNGGASFFVVGRDAAGMKGSAEAEAHPDDDLYKGEHARYVLQMSPVLEDREMGLISFDKFYYDTKDHQMKAMDPARDPSEFISISGSKMRALAAQGATPCKDPIPSDLLAANCVPQGFMAQSGWDIVCDYYQHAAASGSKSGSNRYIPWSKPVVALTTQVGAAAAYTNNGPGVASGTAAYGVYGTLGFRLYLGALPASLSGSSAKAAGAVVSPWHDVPLVSAPASAAQPVAALHMVTEIPARTTAKMEVSKALAGNPIAQDDKSGVPRYYRYGVPFFNYGLLPQTWEDPADCGGFEGACGDDDPLDVVEVGSGAPLAMGSVTAVKVLGCFELVDEGETDYKIVALSLGDPDAHRVHDMSSLELAKPGTTARLADWLRRYKTAEGKGEGVLASEAPLDAAGAMAVVARCSEAWAALASGAAANPNGHALPLAAKAAQATPLAALLHAGADAGAGVASAGSASPAPQGAGSSAAFQSPASGPTTSGVGGTFTGCMALCRSLGGDAMQQQCVSGCVAKYGRRNLRL